MDFGNGKQLRRWGAFNISVGNLVDKHYFETQNYFESRVAPGADVISRIHLTPGYPMTITAGLTFKLGGKI